MGALSMLAGLLPDAITGGNQTPPPPPQDQTTPQVASPTPPVAKENAEPADSYNTALENVRTQSLNLNKQFQDLQSSLDKRVQPPFNPMLMRLAAGLLKPTKTGAFGESIGNAADEAANEAERQRQQTLDTSKLKLELGQKGLEMAQSQAELERQLKLRDFQKTLLVPVKVAGADGKEVTKYQLNSDALQGALNYSNDPKFMSDVADTVQKLRKSGMIYQGQAEGATPFDAYLAVLPKDNPLYITAENLQKSYRDGTMDPEKADQHAQSFGIAVNSFLDKRKEEDNRDSQDANGIWNSMSEDQKRLDSEQYLLTGKINDYGMKTGLVTSKLKNYALQVFARQNGWTPEEVAQKVAENKGNQLALQKLLTNMDQVSSFEKTANLNADQALQQSDKITRGSVKMFNRWKLAGQNELASDPDLAAFNVANETFVNEYAKVMSGGIGNTPTSDAKVAAALKMLHTSMNEDEYKSAIMQMKKDMANRMQGYHDQIGENRARTTGSTSTTQQTSNETSIAARPAGVPANAQYSPSQKSWWWQENGAWKHS